MTTEQPSTRTHILRCGERLIATKGFVGVGLAEILAAAGVPKGSFYHYFSSKERFGEALLASYMERYLAHLEQMLVPDGQPARVRLMRYWAYWNVSQCGVDGPACDAGTGEGSKCLVVKLSAEVADMSDTMRIALRDGATQIVARLARCLREAVQDGSVPQATDPEAMALTLYEMWLGASLLAKLRRDGSSFEHALRATDALLGGADAGPGAPLAPVRPKVAHAQGGRAAPRAGKGKALRQPA
ncbi:TetR/AcrR family transcriptional regulator [Acidovorax sp. LjRoot66]|uniref:TetR/AcrR family transcriptional regulator n=1 Tax=Acidovorax sp. LjRoot66 TaxID=3342334 RepID=UPI003ECF11B4